ncbi:hypothetical protein LCGC14_2973030 [marine sediment metagenome]|uniref:Uncharacterized protein n=1 Tax=marine sediment metagenome TaxID=412755 RepID=A0A0F8X9R4_9ZZZZ
MGIYVCGKQEIKDAVKKALDDLEGEVFKKDVEKVFGILLRNYKYFTK